MAYFDTKSGSLEEAIRQAVGGKINEKLDAVNQKLQRKSLMTEKTKTLTMMEMSIHLTSFYIKDVKQLVKQ